MPIGKPVPRSNISVYPASASCLGAISTNGRDAHYTMEPLRRRDGLSISRTTEVAGVETEDRKRRWRGRRPSWPFTRPGRCVRATIPTGAGREVEASPPTPLMPPPSSVEGSGIAPSSALHRLRVYPRAPSTLRNLPTPAEVKASRRHLADKRPWSFLSWPPSMPRSSLKWADLLAQTRGNPLSSRRSLRLDPGETRGEHTLRPVRAGDPGR
jgi:hypothetical protein